MARRRFFVPQVHQGRAELTGEEAQHLTRVLRVEVGEIYEISDNRQAWRAEVETARKSLVIFQTLEPVPPKPPTVTMDLYLALIKFDRLEWILEKATELGVSSVHPVLAERSERGLDKGAEKRAERWQRILTESSQQCRRDHLPELHPVRTLKQVAGAEATCRFLLDEAEGTPLLLSRLPESRPVTDRVALLIGPEGGWADHEREAITAAGWTGVSLGPLILRAETAAIAAIAIAGHAWMKAG